MAVKPWKLFKSRNTFGTFLLLACCFIQPCSLHLLLRLLYKGVEEGCEQISSVCCELDTPEAECSTDWDDEGVRSTTMEHAKRTGLENIDYKVV